MPERNAVLVKQFEAPPGWEVAYAAKLTGAVANGPDGARLLHAWAGAIWGQLPQASRGALAIDLRDVVLDEPQRLEQIWDLAGPNGYLCWIVVIAEQRPAVEAAIDKSFARIAANLDIAADEMRHLGKVIESGGQWPEPQD